MHAFLSLDRSKCQPLFTSMLCSRQSTGFHRILQWKPFSREHSGRSTKRGPRLHPQNSRNIYVANAPKYMAPDAMHTTSHDLIPRL